MTMTMIMFDNLLQVLKSKELSGVPQLVESFMIEIKRKVTISLDWDRQVKVFLFTLLSCTEFINFSLICRYQNAMSRYLHNNKVKKDPNGYDHCFFYVDEESIRHYTYGLVQDTMIS